MVTTLTYLRWWCLLAFPLLLPGVSIGQLTWTPVLPAQPDQVDLWTQTQSGCSCTTGRRDQGDCACCVPRVACPCGESNHHRCAQCGIQHYCNNMCNMTIDGALLSVSSGTLEGSLISPVLSGPPIYCWYSLRAPRGHRVEVQIHRLVHIGTSINETACRGGYVEVSDQDRRFDEDTERYDGGVERWTTSDGSRMWKSRNGGWNSQSGQNVLRVCGEDQRLHPPAVLFSNSGVATIIYRVRGNKGSPRFLAYYNFPPVTHPLTGDKQWGGSRIEYTECDWLYQDVHCGRKSSCHLTSPGFPGIYPSDIKCKYLFTMGAASSTGTINFISIDLPSERCATDYIALYAGTSTSSPLIRTLCGRTSKTVRFKGPNALLVFSSGRFLSPFQFSGFHASVHFNDEEIPPESEEIGYESSPNPLSNQLAGSILSDPSEEGKSSNGCVRVFWSNSSRSGHFDTSTYAQTHQKGLLSGSPSTESLSTRVKDAPGAAKVCELRFIGDASEIVQISFFKYRLDGESCLSEVFIYDGVYNEETKNLIQHICSPITREPKDSKGRFIQSEFLTSSSRLLEIHFDIGAGTDVESQFLAGAYQFHNSRVEGTKKPDSLCDVMFYGAHSDRQGVVNQPRSALMWNIEGPLICSYFFVPAANQSLQLKIDHLSGIRGSGHCSTECNDRGCECVPKQSSITNVDHLLIIDNRLKEVVGCFCGDVKQNTPISLFSTSSIDVQYHVARYVWSSPGFNFSLSYAFTPQTLCGTTNHNTPAGLLVPPSSSSMSPAQYIYGFCSYIVESQEDTHLTVVVQPPSEGSCKIWNITVKARTRVGDDKHLGEVCAGGAKGSFELYPSQSAAVINLNRGGRPVRDWLITWHTRRSGVAITDEENTPKPELSRTLHGHKLPTGKTFIVRNRGSRVCTTHNIVFTSLFIALVDYVFTSNIYHWFILSVICIRAS